MRRTPSSGGWPVYTCAAFIAVLALLRPFACGAVTTFGHDPNDAVLKDVGVDERLGAQVPTGLVFTDQDGRSVKLADYLTGGPVLLSLNYYRCPMLCPLTFRNLARTIDGLGGIKPGRDFNVVTVSFDPDEKQETASEKSRETYAMLSGVDDPGRAWPFLFGEESRTKAIADAVGYRFAKLPDGQFAHPSVFVVLTPDGRVSRYLYGLDISPFDLRLALAEASGGGIGPSQALNGVLLFCYHYDPAGRKYALAATRLMSVMGGAVGIGLAALLFAMWKKEKSRGDRSDT